MTSKLLKVVHVDEDAAFPRFMIEDQVEHVWNGTEFVADRAEGQLFADSNNACLVLQEILKKDLGERVLFRFKAPVFIEVFADPATIVNPLEVAAWLSRTCRLQMNAEEDGLGLENCVVLPTIHFHEIEECDEGT